MANTRELRRRIKSVKNTAQITKAMQMVAATKMRRAQTQALASRPYDQTLSQSLSRLIERLEEGSHPLLNANASKKVGVILLSTDKSLCGALNTNLFRAILNSPVVSGNTSFYTVGKKGRDFVVRTGKDLIADFENTEAISFRQAVQVGKLATESFLSGELGEVYVAYPHFSSAIRQEPQIVKLLPIDASVTLNEVKGIYPSSKTQDDKVKNQDETEFLFEPNIDELLEYILTHSVETKIYQSMLETKASEHSARMLAMQNATDNARELVGDLELSYNQIRQESITRELLEITSASAALE